MLVDFIFSFALPLVSTKSPVQWVIRIVLPRVKQPKVVAKHLPLGRVDIKIREAILPSCIRINSVDLS